MKIIINTISLLNPLTGVGKYTYYISKELKEIDSENDYTYFYRYYSKKLLNPFEQSGNFSVLSDFIRKIPVLKDAVKRVKNIGALFGGDFDLYFEPNFIPINMRAKKTVVTVFDFAFKLHPEWHPEDRVKYFEKEFWKKIVSADGIIVISDYIKDTAIQHFHFPKEKIRRIYLGYDRSIFRLYFQEELNSVRKKYNLPEEFILYTGSIEPRKNLIGLIRAYLSLEDNIKKSVKLVLAGFEGWRNNEIIEMINKENAIKYLGYVPEKDLGKIYNLASVFVYPSFYEGFGLPPLEAMACGCPVIVSKGSSLPEICGDAAYYIDPYNIDSIREGLVKVLIDDSVKKDLREKGIKRAMHFSWESSAREHLKFFLEV